MKPIRGVIIFCRVPGEEPAKTRLAETLGPAAAAIYEACLLDTLEAAIQSRADRVALCFSPADARDALLRWLRARPESDLAISLAHTSGESVPGPVVELWPQNQGDLGKRMTAAFGAALNAGWDQAVIVGSDIPGLHPVLIDRALNARRPVVFGPALDGGFYLVGMGRTTPLSRMDALFDGVGWSAPDTLLQALDRAGSGEGEVELLEAWPDLDVADDIPVILRLLRAHWAIGHKLAPRLMPLLEEAAAARSHLPVPGAPRCTSVFRPG